MPSRRGEVLQGEIIMILGYNVHYILEQHKCYYFLAEDEILNSPARYGLFQ